MATVAPPPRSLEMPDATRTRTRPRAPPAAAADAAGAAGLHSEGAFDAPDDGEAALLHSDEEDAADIDGIRQSTPEFTSSL